MSSPDSQPTNPAVPPHREGPRSSGVGAQLSRALREYRTRRALARCTRVGEGAAVCGVPSVRNHGRLEIGARLQMLSEPVVSHLVVERGALIRLGDDVRIAHGCGIAASVSIELGDRVSLGAFTLIIDTDYHVPGNPSAPAPCTPIRIGNGVHIGQRVVVLRGSIIGDGTIVKDGSVVAGAIPPGLTVGGVPAREMTFDAPVSAAHAAVLDRVAAIAKRTFRLTQLPEADHGPDDIAAWDSLGALSFLFALESEFGVVLDEGAFAHASTVRKAAETIERVLATRETRE